MACIRKLNDPEHQSGQVIDVAIYEAVSSIMMESVVSGIRPRRRGARVFRFDPHRHRAHQYLPLLRRQGRHHRRERRLHLQTTVRCRWADRRWVKTRASRTTPVVCSTNPRLMPLLLRMDEGHDRRRGTGSARSMPKYLPARSTVLPTCSRTSITRHAGCLNTVESNGQTAHDPCDGAETQRHAWRHPAGPVRRSARTTRRSSAICSE